MIKRRSGNNSGPDREYVVGKTMRLEGYKCIHMYKRVIRTANKKKMKQKTREMEATLKIQLAKVVGVI